jgi:hypothetical protein
MGAYINPVDETKEEFLLREGKPIYKNHAKTHSDFEEFFLVCHVNNGNFTAAGIAYDKNERDAWFADENDKRPSSYFLVPKERLLQVSNLQIYLDQEKPSEFMEEVKKL